MSENKVHFRHILLYYFKKGKRAAEAHRKICGVYRDDALTERAAQKWFAKFRSGNTSLQDGPRSNRPIEDDLNDIKAFATAWLRGPPRCLGAAQADRGEPGQPHVHLQFTSEATRKRPVSQTNSDWRRKVDHLRQHSAQEITGEPPNAIPKTGLHSKKILLSIWWDHRGVLFYEQLPQGKTIDSKIYCTQLTKLNQALRQKRPELVNCKGVIFHYNNARPHRNHSAKISATWLGCFAPLTRPCAIRLPLVPVPAKLPQREIVR
ncbi:PREDICTED: histone-lysine N-methyltransferase SETMAR-like [Acromyrmex echinatior]|uniref:histone-lysine N-methyltransferase SETMAR-like n=1 Tax=Acromyrmex echinatior TaxID=103372 RepID=UPI000580FD58|nr:PREDICTED: histone-lysine N-methyltransferase SETMAR-like [Acromyrmex echinatior]